MRVDGSRSKISVEISGSYHAVTAIVASPLLRCGSQMGLYKLKRCSHKGYLTRVVVIGLSQEGHSRALSYLIMV